MAPPSVALLLINVIFLISTLALFQYNPPPLTAVLFAKVKLVYVKPISEYKPPPDSLALLFETETLVKETVILVSLPKQILPPL